MPEIIQENDNPYLAMSPEQLTDELYMVREELRSQNAVVKSIEDTKSKIEHALAYYHQCNPQVKRIGTDVATVAFDEETVFNCTDWEQAFQFIAENQAFYLLKRQLNNAPLRDMQNMGQLPAFAQPFKRVKVGCTKAPAKKR